MPPSSEIVKSVLQGTDQIQTAERNQVWKRRLNKHILDKAPSPRTTGSVANRLHCRRFRQELLEFFTTFSSPWHLPGFRPPAHTTKMWEKESVAWMHNSQVLKTTRCLNLRGLAHSLLFCSQDSLIQSQGCRVWITVISHQQSPNMHGEFGGIKQGDVLSTTFKNWLRDKSQCQGNLAIRRKRQPRKSLWDRRDNRKEENRAGVKQGLTKQGRAKNSASCLSALPFLQEANGLHFLHRCGSHSPIPPLRVRWPVSTLMTSAQSTMMDKQQEHQVLGWPKVHLGFSISCSWKPEWTFWPTTHICS